MPKVSIIINCFNGAKYLKEAIDSVFIQTYTDWEIVFWDNTSIDNSAEIARSYGEKVRYFRSPETYPLGKARNLAVEKAKGEYIAFLDCDDIWLPKKLEKQIPLFTDPQAGLVYCGALHFLDGTKFAYSTYDIGPNACRGSIFGNLLTNFGLTFSTVIIRRSALDDIPWFPEEMVMAEDMDLILRIAYSWKIDYVLEPLVKYRVHERNTTVKATESAYQEREEIFKRLVSFFPSIVNEYKRELARFREQTTLIHAHALWQKNERLGARKTYLRLFRTNGKWRLLVLFFLTYFYSFEQFHKLGVKIKYRVPKFMYNTYKRLNF